MNSSVGSWPRILTITSCQSQIVSQQNPITTVFGLGEDMNVYAWDYNTKQWFLYGTK